MIIALPLYLHLHELITEEEYKEKKAVLSAQRDQETSRLDTKETHIVPHPATAGFQLGATLKRMFLKGGPEGQRVLLFSFDRRATLKDRSVTWVASTSFGHSHANCGSPHR